LHCPCWRTLCSVSKLSTCCVWHLVWVDTHFFGKFLLWFESPLQYWEVNTLVSVTHLILGDCTLLIRLLAWWSSRHPKDGHLFKKNMVLFFICCRINCSFQQAIYCTFWTATFQLTIAFFAEHCQSFMIFIQNNHEKKETEWIKIYQSQHTNATFWTCQSEQWQIGLGKPSGGRWVKLKNILKLINNKVFINFKFVEKMKAIALKEYDF